jgi:hypothetical protein
MTILGTLAGLAAVLLPDYAETIALVAVPATGVLVYLGVRAGNMRGLGARGRNRP